jgi:hypothetical protein
MNSNAAMRLMLAISPWTGPEADPIPVVQTDAGPEAVVNRVRVPAPQHDDHI